MTEPADLELKRALIVRAALVELANPGPAGATLRTIAGTAGVSIGVIQHHFGSKARLVEEVDRCVLRFVRDAFTAPKLTPPDQFAHKVRGLLGSDHDRAVLDYLARAVVEDAPIGRVVFDTMATLGITYWDELAAAGQTPADLDTVWAGLNTLVLLFGTVLLRRHLNRSLPEPFTTNAQLDRWEHAVNGLVTRGQTAP